MAQRAGKELRVRRIALVVADDVYPGSMLAAFDVLQIANIHVRSRVQQVLPGASRKRSTVTLTVLSPDGAPVTAMGRVQIRADEALGTSQESFDAVIVPALMRRSARALAERLGALDDVYEWLRKQRDQGAVFAASYTGVFALAEAGLLDGHTATVAVNLEKEFRQRYPAVKLDLARSIVEDRNTVCAAALGGNLEMIWRLVERFRSGVIAWHTAHELFFHGMDVDRSPPGADPAPARVRNPLIERARYWLMRNISAKTDVGELAHVLSISERTLFRHFKRATGMTPNAYVQSLRIDSAKSSLEYTDDSIATIAAYSGYGDKAFFSKVFREHTGLTPRAYRNQMRQQHGEQLRRADRMAV